MSEMSIEIDSSGAIARLNEFMQNFMQVNTVLEEDVLDGVELMVDTAKILAPVDKGVLRDSIHYEGQFPDYSIVVDAQNEAGQFYGYYVEWGCFSDKNNVKILTKTGWKSWKDIKIGDEVYTHLGRWKKVLEKYQKKLNKGIPRIIVQLDIGEKIPVTYNHKFLTIDNGNRNWKNASNLKTNDKIICLFNERSCQICGNPLKPKQKTLCSKICKNKFFSKQTPKTKFYEYPIEKQNNIRELMSEIRKKWWENKTPEERSIIAKKGVKSRGSYFGKDNPNYGRRYKLIMTEKERKRRGERDRGRNNPMYKYPRYGEYFSNYGYREDLGHVCRSSWEANFCRVLNHMNIKYDFEPKTFTLSNGQSYTPDFYIHDNNGYYVEVKGYFDEKKKEKLSRFLKEYPTIKLSLITSKEYKDIEEAWKHIPNWEEKNFKIFNPENLHEKICNVTKLKKINTWVGNVYDLIVEDDHSYVANNMVVHNTSKQGAQPFLWPAINAILPKLVYRIRRHVKDFILGR